MSRPLRIEYENAWYHIMNRGASRRAIFYNNKDRQDFLCLLEDIHQRYQVETHAYCLMSNHYHLLLHTPHANISRAIRHLNGVYTQQFNKNHGADGPLFRGRFKSLVIESELYLTRLSRYIHLNPVDAKIVDSPEKYPWSSYRAYLNLEEKPNWLYCDDVLTYFGLVDDVNSVINYVRYVSENVDNELRDFYDKIRLGSMLGSDSFKKSMVNRVDSESLVDVSGAKTLKQLTRPPIQKVLDITASFYNISTNDLISSKPKKSNWPRLVAIYLCVEITGQQYQDIANKLERCTKHCVSQSYRRVKKRIDQHENVRHEVLCINNKLNES